MAFHTIGKSEFRRDLPEKLTGEAKYTSDVQLPGMLWGKILRSPVPHALIQSVDSTSVLNAPGVHSVVTPFDVPQGSVAPDMSILDTEVRYVGDEIAAVAAEDEDLAESALSLIQAQFELLPFVTDAREALKVGAPKARLGGNLVGGKPLTLARGSIKEGFAKADRIFEDTFSTSAQAGAALEPRAVVASWNGDELTVWKSTRGVHADQLALSLALDMPLTNVRIVGQNMGAGYGTKDETRLAAITAILSRRAGRPVKIELTRQEEFVAGRHRHGTSTNLRIGVKDDGTLTAIHATTIMDTGAYLATGPGVIRRAGQGALYLYRCANVRYDGYLVYTNTPSGGSYRALGAPQGHFALESLVDTIAETLGMDPLAFRLKNHVRIEGQPGERITPQGNIVDAQPVEGGIPFSSNGLKECLEKGAKAIGWGHALKKSELSDLRRGQGVSMFIYRGGVGDKTVARMRLEIDGGIHLITGLMDVGEGSLTVITQIAAEELGVRYQNIRTTFGDSSITPKAPMTAGSTATFSTGTATKKVAGELKERIVAVASELLKANPGDLLVTDNGVEHQQYARQSVTFAQIVGVAGAIEVEVAVSPGSPDHIINSFGAHFAEVEVDITNGRVTVLRYVAAHDSGRILNPKLAVNQVEGGVSQMLGFTLSEQMLIDNRTGVTLNASFLEHKSPTIKDYPDLQVLFANVTDPIGPFGAKALGEPPSIGVAPAVANAIYNAIGIRYRDLPMSPDRILNLIAEQKGFMK